MSDAMMPAFRRAMRRILTVGASALLALLVLMVLLPAGIWRNWMVVGVEVWMIANLVIALACYVVEEME